MSETKKAELEAQIGLLQRELRKIEDTEATERNRYLVGRCFRYRNCYSCPEKDSDYWWLYCRVLSVRGDTATVLDFQTDKDGRMEMRPSHFRSAMSLASGGSYQPIPRKQFRAALRSFLARVAKSAREQERAK
jgi:hypothetical protein